MKKTGSIVAAVLILIVSVIGVVLLLGRSSAADDSTLSLSSSASNVQDGDTVEVEVSLDAAETFLAVSADVVYDTSALEFVGFEDNDLLVAEAEDESGSIELILGDTSAVSGELGVLTFTAKTSSGSTTIDVQNAEAGDGGDAGSTTLLEEDVTISFGSGTGGTGNGFFISAKNQDR